MGNVLLNVMNLIFLCKDAQNQCWEYVQDEPNSVLCCMYACHWLICIDAAFVSTIYHVVS